MKKTKLTRSLLAACSIVALTAVMYGCTHSGDDGVPQTDHDQVVDDKDKAEAEAAALREQINALRTQLGLEADDDLGDSIAELQSTLAGLRQQLQDTMSKADEAKMEGLFAAIRAKVGNDAARVVAGDPAAAAATVTDNKTKMTLAASYIEDNKDDPMSVPFADHFGPGDHALADNTDVKGVMAARFPQNGGQITYAIDTDADTDIPPAAELSGTLMGAAGTFRCATAPCTITENEGAYRFSPSWIFDPDDGVSVTVEDGDYTHFGWWAFLRKDGTYRVETFYGHSGAADHASDIDTLDSPQNLGTATYTGKAVGKYAIDNRPTGDTLEAAHFTANAKIDAAFAATTTITGTIDKFMVDGAPKEWSVSLGKTNVTFADGNDFDSSDDTASDTDGIAVGGEKNIWTIGPELTGVAGAPDGDWMGAFYHDGDPRDDGTPATVIGSFTASHGGNAYMAGAFGAHNEASDSPGN